eukprot:scaffold16092_cov127-Isochrysis_galbana.AAC.13
MMSVPFSLLWNRDRITSRDDRLSTQTRRPVSMSKAEQRPDSASPKMSPPPTTISRMEERRMKANSGSCDGPAAG